MGWLLRLRKDSLRTDLTRGLALTICLCAFESICEGQVWNRSYSPPKSAATNNRSNPDSGNPANAPTAPAVPKPTNGEQPEPQVDLRLPRMSSNQQFELNHGAFQQPRQSTGTATNPATAAPTTRNVNEVSSSSSRPLPRLRSHRAGGLFSNHSRQHEDPSQTARRPVAQTNPQEEVTQIQTADAETNGPIVAPMPQRQNADGSRTPIASFGAWDVHRSTETNRSTRTATLTQDEQHPSSMPSFRVPMQPTRDDSSVPTQTSDPLFQSPVNSGAPQEQPPALSIPNLNSRNEHLNESLPQSPATTLSEPGDPPSHGAEWSRDAYDARSPLNTVAEPPNVASSPTFAHETLYWWEKELAGSLLRDRSPMPLSLPDALQAALNEAPELKILHADWYIQLQEQIRQDAAFDWTTFVNSVWNRDSTPVGSQLDGAAQRLRSRTASASAGLRRLDRYGGQFEISQQLGLRESNSQFISPNFQGNSRLNLRYEKPLLRGAGKEYATGPLQLSELDKDIAFDRMQSGIQDHLLEVARAYWALVLTRGDFLQKITSWNRARAIADEMESRVEIDVMPGTLDRARAEVATRLAQSIQAEHDVQTAQEVLLELIYASNYTLYTRNEIITTTLPPHAPSEIDVESQADVAVHARSEVHQAIREIRAATIEYQLSQIDMKPRLDLVLSGYSAGLNPNYDVGNSFVNQFNQGEPGAGMGLEYELPYKNRAAKAAAEQRRVALTRLQREFEDIVGEVKQDVRSQAIRRNKFAATLPQQSESLQIARRLMEYTQTRRNFLADGVEVGDLYLSDLLQIQSRVQNAEFQYLQAQVSFAVADNAFLRSLGSLQSLAEGSATPSRQSVVPVPANEEPAAVAEPTGEPVTSEWRLPSPWQKKQSNKTATPQPISPASHQSSAPTRSAGHAGLKK